MNATTSLPACAWYLVQCKPGQDERAELNLMSQGYTCLRPKHQRERVLRGRRSLVCESLFPGYLFIQLNINDHWAPLRSTRGVSRVVTFGGNPLPVREELVARFRQHNHTLEGEGCFEFGDKVRIDAGPFAELDAIFLTMEGEKRVVLLMKCLHGEKRISLPLAGIHKR